MKSSYLHWFLGIPAVLFVLLFTILPMYEAIEKLFISSDDFLRIVYEKNLQPWFFYSRNTYILANLLYALLNIVMLTFSTIYLFKKKSIDLLITFMIFLGFHFIVLFLAGNWISPGQ